MGLRSRVTRGVGCSERAAKLRSRPGSEPCRQNHAAWGTGSNGRRAAAASAHVPGSPGVLCPPSSCARPRPSCFLHVPFCSQRTGEMPPRQPTRAELATSRPSRQRARREGDCAVGAAPVAPGKKRPSTERLAGVLGRIRLLPTAADPRHVGALGEDSAHGYSRRPVGPRRAASGVGTCRREALLASGPHDRIRPARAGARRPR